MSQQNSASNIINIVVSFLLVAILLPIGLDALFDMVLPETIDASIETLLLVVLPLFAVLGIALAYIPRKLGKR